MSRFMRSGWVGFSSSLRVTHENNVVKNFVEWFYFVLLESFTESILQREREREREGLFDIIWLWYTRWVDWILKFVKGNDLYDRFEFDTFYSLSAFPKA